MGWGGGGGVLKPNIWGKMMKRTGSKGPVGGFAEVSKVPGQGHTGIVGFSSIPSYLGWQIMPWKLLFFLPKTFPGQTVAYKVSTPSVSLRISRLSQLHKNFTYLDQYIFEAKMIKVFISKTIKLKTI